MGAETGPGIPAYRDGVYVGDIRSVRACGVEVKGVQRVEFRTGPMPTEPGDELFNLEGTVAVDDSARIPGPVLSVLGTTWTPGTYIPDEADLHSLMTEVCDPTCRTLCLATPWLDGPTVWATDGAVIATQRADNLHPDLRAALASMKGDRRPKDLATEVQRLQPTASKQVVLPAVDMTPPGCPKCQGSGGRRLIVGGLRPAACPACAGTGRAPRSGETVEVAGWKLDRWYCHLMRKHNAVVYPPVMPTARLSGSPRFAFRFKAGPVTGWVLVAGAAAPILTGE